MIRRMLVWGLVATAGLGGLSCKQVESDPDEPSEQQRPSHKIVAEFGGEKAYTYAVDSQGSIVVFGRGSDVVVADVSDPSRPAVLGAAALSGEVRAIDLQGSFAFVAADSGGLEIIDLSDPRHPDVIAQIAFRDRAYGVAAEGDYVYVAARSEGLRVVDVSSPSQPAEVGHIVTPDEAVDVVVRDGYAFVAAWYESMRVIDISDPTSPEEISFASYDSYDNGAAWSVFVDGDLGLATVPDIGLRTVDISDPHDVKLYKVYRGLFSPAGVAARGRTAYVADQDAGFRVLDLSDPVNPTEIGSLDLPGRAMAVMLADEVAYVAAREGGLRIIDVSRPYDPREIGHVDDGDEVVDIIALGDTIVAAGLQNGVSFYREAMELESTRYLSTPVRRVVALRQQLLVAAESEIIAYDLSDQTRSQAELNIPGSIRGIASSGDVVVVATEQFGLRIIQPRGPGSLLEVGAYEPNRSAEGPADHLQILRTPIASWDVIIDGDRAIAAFDDGIRVIDITEPSRPVLIGYAAFPERAYRLVLRGSHLFAACDDGLRVVDLSDPADPTIVAYTKTPSFATSLLLDEDRVYVGDLSGAITAIGASDPFDRITEVHASDRVLGMAMVRDGIAVAAGWQGIRILSDVVEQ